MKIYWPTFIAKDKQCDLYSHNYNEENGTFQVEILWANTMKAKKCLEKSFTANHFTLLAEENMVINRLKKLEIQADEEPEVIDILDDDSNSKLQNKDEEIVIPPADDTEPDVENLNQESGVENLDQVPGVENLDQESGMENLDQKTGMENLDQTSPVGAKYDSLNEKQTSAAKTDGIDKGTIDVQSEPLHEQNSNEEESDQLSDAQGELIMVEPKFVAKHRFRDWYEVLEKALAAKEGEFTDLKKVMGIGKHGEIYVVDWSDNCNRLKDGKPLKWSDFEGQWNGKVSKGIWQIFARESDDEELHLKKKYSYDKDKKEIYVRKTNPRQTVSQKFYLNALVIYRYKSYHGKDVNYQRNITIFLHVPSGMDAKILKRAVYEYMGNPPGFKPHKNRKVFTTL